LTKNPVLTEINNIINLIQTTDPSTINFRGWQLLELIKDKLNKIKDSINKTDSKKLL